MSQFLRDQGGRRRRRLQPAYGMTEYRPRLGILVLQPALCPRGEVVFPAAQADNVVCPRKRLSRVPQRSQADRADMLFSRCNIVFHSPTPSLATGGRAITDSCSTRNKLPCVFRSARTSHAVTELRGLTPAKGRRTDPMPMRQKDKTHAISLCAASPAGGIGKKERNFNPARLSVR
jgi:hypothetical protein